MTPAEMLLHANHLDQLQKVENDGRGIACVRSIIHYLRLGDWSSALNVRRTEGDKTRAYPKVERELTQIFGCLLHAKYNCGDWLCR